jgi:uncharacterized protein YlaN (UPF0358 family)
MTIPYLLQTIPPNFTGVECKSINDMVSVNLQQVAPTSTIPYRIGSSDNIRISLQLKNLTNNAQLEVEVVVDENIFLIDNSLSGSSKKILLDPEQTKGILLSLNKERLNSTVNSTTSTVAVKITNITNGTVVTKNTSVSSLTVAILNDVIEIVN